MESPKGDYGFHQTYSPTRLTSNTTIQMHCHDSPITNHIVMHSFYNDMLGEFYNRAVVGLFELFRAQHVRIDEFIKYSKLYIHRMIPTKPLLESHQLFTNAFRSTQLGDFFNDLLYSVQCRCLPRILFCGYDVTLTDSNRSTYLTPGEGIYRNNTNNPLHANLRNFLRERLIGHNPFANSDIQQFQHQLLERVVGIDNNNTQTEWKFVGLAQRSGRRRWNNLNDVLGTLSQQMLEYGIVLLEVNVEENDWTAYNQMIRHAALDG